MNKFKRFSSHSKYSYSMGISFESQTIGQLVDITNYSYLTRETKLRGAVDKQVICFYFESVNTSHAVRPLKVGPSIYVYHFVINIIPIPEDQ